MMTQGQKMLSIALSPLALHERVHATDVERIDANLYLRPHYVPIVECLRPVEFIVYLNAPMIMHQQFFSAVRCGHTLEEKFLIVVHLAIGAHPAQDYASVIFLARRPFERCVVIVTV